jgi:hypothetical protein
MSIAIQPKEPVAKDQERREETKPVLAYTIDQVARILEIPSAKIAWWIRTGQLKAYKYKETWYILEQELLVVGCNVFDAKIEENLALKKKLIAPEQKSNEINATKAAVMIGITLFTLSKYIREGRLPAITLPSGRYQLDLKEVEAFKKTYVQHRGRKAGQKNKRKAG